MDNVEGYLSHRIGTLPIKNISIFNGLAHCHIILGCRPMRCVTDETILEKRIEEEEAGTEERGDAVPKCIVLS